MKPHRLRVDLEKHICTELTVAEFDRLPTETTLGEANFKPSFYDGLSRLAKVCIVHGVLRSKEVTSGNCCSAQTFSYNKRNDFSVAQQFHVLIPAAMSTLPPQTMLLAIWRARGLCVA